MGLLHPLGDADHEGPHEPAVALREREVLAGDGETALVLAAGEGVVGQQRHATSVGGVGRPAAVVGIEGDLVVGHPHLPRRAAGEVGIDAGCSLP